MNRKHYVHMALIAALATTAVGCSSGGGSSSSSPAAGSNDFSKKVSMSLMKFIFVDVPPNDAPAVKMINEKFNVDFQPNLVPQGTYDDKLTAVLASGKIPDILLLENKDQFNRYPKFAKQGAFAPLDDYIKQYPSLQRIPQYVIDQFKMDGKLYAIPGYYPKFPFTVMLRKDWLDALNLKVPTSYEELKQVALAFTKNDPDKNGKNDTYGIAIGKDLNWPMTMGAYWDPDAWYHKDAQGRFIPGIISNARKDIIQMFADLYKEGAMTKDFASLDWAATNKEFYSGKAGIFVGTPRGMVEANSDALVKLNPNAQFVHLEPFVAPDGSKGFNATRGFTGITTISAEAAKDPVKMKRILDFIEFGRKFYTTEQKNDKNADFDWYMGKVGTGYDLINNVGVAKTTSWGLGVMPWSFFPDTSGVPVKDSDWDYTSTYGNPVLRKVVADISKTYANLKYYNSPNYTAVSETQLTKGAELTKYLYDEQTKMVAGQRPIADWDKMVDEWKSKGGEAVIKETNAGIKIKDAKEAWDK